MAPQETVHGDNGGLVIYPMGLSSVSVYIQPVTVGSADWTVTLEASHKDTSLSSDRLRQLCTALTSAAALCEFLQDRARALG